jgi:hypothetical protein
MVPPPSQNTVGVCNQTTLLILYYISSRLVILLKVTDDPTQVSDIFNLTVSFKFINFSFWILLFVPEMFTIFSSYTVYIILHCFGLDPLITSIWPAPSCQKNLNILMLLHFVQT